MRCALREVRDEDLSVLFEQWADPVAMHMAAFTRPDHMDREAFQRRWARLRDDETLLNRAIVVDGEVAGTIGSWGDPDEREVTYWIGRSYWGKGIATSALEAFLAVDPVRPLHARVAADNVASKRVLEKCGFRVIGTDRGFAQARSGEIDEFVLRLDESESLWPRLAELPLVVEACEYERLHAVLAYEFERFTTHVRFVGGGTEGLGEDISAFREDGTTLHETRPSLPLEGTWTLGGFSEHLAGLTLWPEPPEWDVALRMRRWAFESAALDLALRQAGRPLHDVLGLQPKPLRFVNSLGLGKEQPSIEPVLRRLARSPGVRFKLDAEESWPPALVDEVAATGAVDTIDFKGQYGLEVKDPAALVALYDHVLDAFPDAYLEDPHDLPEIAERLRDHVDRVSYDAPIRSAEDIGATPLPARVVNVKPARIGDLQRLFEVYARCAQERRPMYGGGFGELGVGRGQIELLAALFHPDTPNDVAPSAYNEDEPAGSLPASPLPPSPAPTGFRWTG